MDFQLYKPGLYKVEKGDVVLFIDPEAPNWAAVNSHGAAVLDGIASGERADEVVRRFSGEYSKEDLRRFIRECIRCGIVGDRPISRAAYPGRASYLAPERLDELWLYVTERCNLRCSHCLVSAGDGRGEELDLEGLKRVIGEARSLGARRIFFTGGEPFTRRDIFALIEHVTGELGLELVILTNGTLLDERRVKRLKGIPGLVVQVSLEGPTAEVNDRIRGEGAFEKALRGIELLRASGIRTIVTSTATKANIEWIPSLNELLHERDVRTHHILWVHRRGRAAKNPVSVDTGRLASLMKSLKEGRVKVDNWESYRARVYGRRGVKVDGCHAAFTAVSVNANGDIYPCPSLNGDERFLMGNVSEGLKKVWQESKVAREFREVSVTGIEGCRDCPFRFLCGGGCRCQAYFGWERPSLLHKDPYCDVIREMLVESMLSLASPDGERRPEILGYMQEHPSPCDCGEPSSGEVSPFHCTCVLDVAAHRQVSERYAGAAARPEADLCCPTGYSDSDLQHLPDDTISISYGCGNPTAFAELKEGESVLDIGAGGGIDCFIAAKKVGRRGRVIGIDMTDEMLDRANRNRVRMAEVLGYDVVEFRKGIAEELPVETGTMDLVISNCVINLSPDKRRVFKEIYRVLKRGGRFSISDIVSDKPVPEEMKQDEELWSGCISGALPREEFLEIIRDAGFADITVEKSYKWKEIGGIGFHSVTIKGKRP